MSVRKPSQASSADLFCRRIMVHAHQMREIVRYVSVKRRNYQRDEGIGEGTALKDEKKIRGTRISLSV